MTPYDTLSGQDVEPVPLVDLISHFTFICITQNHLIAGKTDIHVGIFRYQEFVNDSEISRSHNVTGFLEIGYLIYTDAIFSHLMFSRGTLCKNNKTLKKLD